MEVSARESGYEVWEDSIRRTEGDQSERRVGGNATIAQAAGAKSFNGILGRRREPEKLGGK